VVARGIYKQGSWGEVKYRSCLPDHGAGRWHFSYIPVEIPIALKAHFV